MWSFLLGFEFTGQSEGVTYIVDGLHYVHGDHVKQVKSSQCFQPLELNAENGKGILDPPYLSIQEKFHAENFGPTRSHQAI